MRTCKFCGATSRHVGKKFICFECRHDRTAQMSKAHALVHRAVVKGDLSHPKKHRCVDCGKKAVCYDHRDYSKPMKVVPLCQSCNFIRGHGKCKARVDKGYIVGMPIRVEIMSYGIWHLVDAMIMDNGAARVKLKHPYGTEVYKTWRKPKGKK